MIVIKENLSNFATAINADLANLNEADVCNNSLGRSFVPAPRCLQFEILKPTQADKLKVMEK